MHFSGVVESIDYRRWPCAAQPKALRLVEQLIVSLSAELERHREARKRWREKYFQTLDAMEKLSQERDRLTREQALAVQKHQRICVSCRSRQPH